MREIKFPKLPHLSKNEKLVSSKKKFRQINSLAICLVKTLLSRNFRQKVRDWISIISTLLWAIVVWQISVKLTNKKKSAANWFHLKCKWEHIFMSVNLIWPNFTNFSTWDWSFDFIPHCASKLSFSTLWSYYCKSWFHGISTQILRKTVLDLFIVNLHWIFWKPFF